MEHGLPTSAPWVEVWSFMEEAGCRDMEVIGHSKCVLPPPPQSRNADDALVFHSETQLDVLDVHG
jgi:hypothetical protein